MVHKLRLCLGSTVAAMLATAVWAQIQQAGAPAAPVPTQIASAKKVFISNMGIDTISAVVFRRELAENKPYNEFYAAVKAWGRYQLVDSPADADLVYEIGFVMPIVGTGEPTAYQPQFNLSSSRQFQAHSDQSNRLRRHLSEDRASAQGSANRSGAGHPARARAACPGHL